MDKKKPIVFCKDCKFSAPATGLSAEDIEDMGKLVCTNVEANRHNHIWLADGISFVSAPQARGDYYRNKRGGCGEEGKLFQIRPAGQ